MDKALWRLVTDKKMLAVAVPAPFFCCKKQKRKQTQIIGMFALKNVCYTVPHAAAEYFNFFERFFVREIADSKKEGKESGVLLFGSLALEDIVSKVNILMRRKDEAFIIRKLKKLGATTSTHCATQEKWEAYQDTNLASRDDHKHVKDIFLRGERERKGSE